MRRALVMLLSLAALILPVRRMAPVIAVEPGVVLYQTHRFSQQSVPDTIVTYVTARNVRVSHVSGDAILDLEENRIVLLDPKTNTYRQMPLRTWEEHILEAIDSSPADSAQRPDLRFQPVGESTIVAGFECDRHMLYTRRELFPGEVDYVETQIWVARDLEMPPGAYEAYERSMGNIASIGLGAVVERPAGVIMLSQTHVRPEGADRKAVPGIETQAVFRVEQTPLPDDTFEIPEGFVEARDATPEDAHE